MKFQSGHLTDINNHSGYIGERLPIPVSKNLMNSTRILHIDAHGTNYELYREYFPAVIIADPAGLLQTAGINQMTAFRIVSKPCKRNHCW